MFAPPGLCSLFGARDFILTGRTGVNRPVAVVEFWRIAGAAAAKETAEERDQRYLYRVHRLRSRLERFGAAVPGNRRPGSRKSNR